jgi:hypothetical protein
MAGDIPMFYIEHIYCKVIFIFMAVYDHNVHTLSSDILFK